MTDNYYLLQDGEKKGPFTYDELVDMGLDIDTRIASPASGTWQDASDLPEFNDYFEANGHHFPTEDNLATFWWRLLAYIIDSIIISVIIAIFVPGLFINIYKNQVANDFSAAAMMDRLKLNIAAFVLSTIYNSICEATEMRGSIGKKICRLMVVDANGSKLSLGKAFVRNVTKFISSAALYIGYLSVLWDDHRQAWHDQIAKTYIIIRNR